MGAEDPRRHLPPVNEVVDHPEVVAAGERVDREYRVRLARRVLEEARRGELDLSGDPAERVRGVLACRLAGLVRPGPRRVLNGTGVPLHTNLGRAPLGRAVRAAWDRVTDATDLELDLATGRRGERHASVSALLGVLCDAEAGLVVNNGAAAVLLAARALARGGEVVVSRGELVEIGGSFRVPEVIESAGARLVEVGTTNRTRAADYAAALGPETRMLLKVHRSNFRVEGFVEEASREELAAVARAHGVPLVEDLGSGCLVDLEPCGLRPEPTPEEALEAGVDLVTFSGDKLLGGMQAGLLAGRAEVVERLRKDPLMRALRLDKVSMAGVLAALAEYLEPEGLEERVPVVAMLRASPEELRERAEALVPLVHQAGCDAEVVEVTAPVGGGSCPGEELRGYAVRFTHPELSAEQVARTLRGGEPPLVVRIEGEGLVLDPRALRAREGEVESALTVLMERSGVS